MNALLSQQPKALLALEDGVVFEGLSAGAAGEASGTAVCCASTSGYQQALTDPAHAGAVMVFTYPQVGNCGVNHEDERSADSLVAGVVCRDMCYTPSNFRLTGSLPDYLLRRGVVAIEGVDTRALALHLRDAGQLRALISTVDLDLASLTRRAAALGRTDQERGI